jgi:hypothetical protein
MATDKAVIQLRRVEVMIGEMRPGLRFVSDPTPVPGTVRFRVISPTGIPIIETSGHLEIEKLESWSDEELRAAILSLSAGRL